MLNSRQISFLIGALLLGVGFVGGLIYLLQLRVDSGDIYPAYSSLRADPLGTMAFYQSLQSLPGLDARRSFEDWPQIADDRNCVLFLAGLGENALTSASESDFKHLEKFLFAGGRVIISMPPAAGERSVPRRFHRIEDDNREPRERPERPEKPSDPEPMFRTISLLDKFGFSLGYERPALNEKGVIQSRLAEAADAPRGSPPLISWHTGTYFTDLDASWQVIYDLKKHPVIIERPYGLGTLVVSADSFWLSNEALRRERHAELLAWLVGDKRTVIFDETHLGVQESGGVAVLMRRYHLDGLIAGLLLLAALFVWKNSSSLVPPLVEERSSGRAVVRGRQSAAGFVNLLRRNVPPGELLSTCFNEWKNASRHNPRLAARLGAVEAVVNNSQNEGATPTQIVGAYQAIQKIVTEKL